MSEIADKYNFSECEKKWQGRWEADDCFKAVVRSDLPKYYCLEMLPYPSGNIHMGHVRNYAIGDVLARYKSMQGFNVLHPMGWDAFGLPAENAAKQNNRHPADWTYSNIKQMKGQLKSMGLSYDWSREIATCHPDYYKWEQLFFIKMWEKGLAYKKKSSVNWCASCETVLANEQVEDGKCWRCSSEVVPKDLEQWFLKITEYAEELLQSTYNLPGWPEKVLTMQRNWIGKSVGAEVQFKIDGSPDTITVFTTRPDTIFGANFMLIAPQHPLSKKLIAGKENEAAGLSFISECILEQQDNIKNPESADDKEKKGFDTGHFCINPQTGKKIPIYICNYVLMGYGTGAVMAVPAHDERDHAFAIKYKLPITQVVKSDNAEDGKPHSGDGIVINSGKFDGMTSQAAKTAITEDLKSKSIGKESITYRLRDWGVSRQRYWGAPVPFINCDKCGLIPVPDKDLPVILPTNVDFQASGNPLDNVPEFVHVKCPKCGTDARRETDTMDTFMESSWYYLRYCCPRYDEGMLDPKEVGHWMPVDQYIGGVEHAVMHLLYARFYTKVLRDFGYLNFDEPFTNLLTQGMVCKETYKCPTHGWLFPQEMENGKCIHCGSDVTVGRIEKMSKSKKNVVDPDSLIKTYGADTLRLFSLFSAPPDKECEWSDSGVEGSFRFINRVYRLIIANVELMKNAPDTVKNRTGLCKEILKDTHATIKKISLDMERFQYNTSVAAVMEFVNSLYQHQQKLETDDDKAAFKQALLALVQLLSPFTPHLAEELWSLCGTSGYVAKAKWPTFIEEYTVSDEITVVVQINGKLRAEMKIGRDLSQEEIINMALNSDKIKPLLDGKEIVKKIYVPGKLVNLVVK